MIIFYTYSKYSSAGDTNEIPKSAEIKTVTKLDIETCVPVFHFL